MKLSWKKQVFYLFILLIFTGNCEETIFSEADNVEESNTATENRYKRRHRRHKAGIPLCPEAGLSDAQKEEIRELRHSFRDSARDTNREDRQDTWFEFEQNVLNTIPTTEEQRAALSNCFERRQNRN